MPKSKQKYYAVKVGRGGPQVYTTWEECHKQVNRYPENRFKSFRSLAEAQEWINPRSSSSISQSPPKIGRKRSTDLQTPILPPDPVDSPPTTPTPTPTTSNTPSSSQAGEQPAAEEPELSPEQTHVLNMVKSGQNVFFTGSAGTGKSVLLRKIITWARSYHGVDEVAVTASTGMAAVNIGGVTLHSWAGIGLGNGELKMYVKAIGDGFGHWGKVLKRWKEVETLIIDEISMIDAALFDKLEYIARIVRENKNPFGGIQLVLSGDFFQLPPVDLRSNKVEFAFQAESWDRCISSVTMLTRVFRQKEKSFVELLNEMRFGKLSEQNKSRLTVLSRQVKYPDSVEPTELFPTKKEVQFANESRLATLSGPAHAFRSVDHSGNDDQGRVVTPQQTEAQLDRCVLAPKSITLKVGAQVMLLKNAEKGALVNGSVGKVVDFFTCQEAKEIHHIMIVLSPRDKDQDPRTGEIRIAEDLWRNQTKWPVVEFSRGRKRLVPRHEFTVENVRGSMQVSRLQVPLILAWAISIHKSQGQTLERVRVNLGKIFEKGQAYVALSRATSLQALQVLNFNPSRVMVHETVLNWHERNTGQVKKVQGLRDIERAINTCEHVDSESEQDYLW